MFKFANGEKVHKPVVGKRFKVVEESSAFTKGSIIELERDDGSALPLFKLITGNSRYDNAEGGKAGAFEFWKCINHINGKEQTEGLCQHQKEVEVVSLLY